MILAIMLLGSTFGEALSLCCVQGWDAHAHVGGVSCRWRVGYRVVSSCRSRKWLRPSIASTSSPVQVCGQV